MPIGFTLRGDTRSLAVVSGLAAFIIITETVLFHIVEYVYDYLAATMVISIAVVAIGLGGLAANWVTLKTRNFVPFTLLGSALCLLASVVSVLQAPFWVTLTVALPLFAFPACFVARAFAEQDPTRTYCADMIGVAAGTATTVLLYAWLRSESIVCLGFAALCAAGCFGPGNNKSLRYSMGALAVVGLVLFVVQLGSDALNFHFLIGSQNSPAQSGKVFYRWGDTGKIKTYDSLIGRIDVAHRRRNRWVVAYNGHANDHFTPRQPKDYDDFYRDVPWPSNDRRVFYGLVSEPRVFIIGSAAEGIVKTIRRLTPLDRITAVEIHPAIIQMMQTDFYEESGKAYESLNVINGNAVAVLAGSNTTYDVITLLNVHNGRTIGHPAAPDFLHTVETYQMLLEHLSPDGYLLFEERPTSRAGQQALYRQVLTLRAALERQGIESPARHLAIWEWQGSRTGRISRASEKYYVSMIVTKEPIEGDLAQRAWPWFAHEQEAVRARGASFNVLYFPQVIEDQTYAALLQEQAPLEQTPNFPTGFDPSPATSDRPFVEFASPTSRSQLATMLAIAAGIGLVLLVLLTVLLPRGQITAALPLGAYNVLIGVGYFVVEIVLFQAYQAYFESPSSTLVLILGVLLLSSAMGGLSAKRRNIILATIALGPCCFLALLMPEWMLHYGAPFLLVKATCVGATMIIGYLMGTYFPTGLLEARRCQLATAIPLLFAMNAVGGSVAVVLAVFLTVNWGYMVTVSVAVVTFAIACFAVVHTRRSISSAA